MNIDEDQLSGWANAPSETEEGKCQHTAERITKAIKMEFGDRVTIFLQGSYKNRTNVKLDSDVDIVVRLNDIYFGDTSGLSEADKQRFMEIPDADYTYDQLKSDTQRILENEFEYGVVERHDKCIKIRKNEQRVNADVVPCFVHKRLTSPFSADVEGIEFRTDRGQRIISFPEQHYENGVSKNKVTGGNYKPIVRILKNIRNNMVDDGVITEKDMPSFFLESLIWNLLPDYFQGEGYSDTTRRVVKKAWNDMRDIQKAGKYAEVSDLKWLFKGNDIRTPGQAENFMLQIWNYVDFE